jgi:hypothetical protein
MHGRSHFLDTIRSFTKKQKMTFTYEERTELRTVMISSKLYFYNQFDFEGEGKSSFA